MPPPLPITPFPMTLAAFRTRFPEFKDTEAELVQATLNDAALVIDPGVWNRLSGQGHGYLTAHRLALSPFGQQARLVKKDGTTTYQTFYEELLFIVAPSGLGRVT